ncbi:DUF4245 domain-containing protein [Jatrophihabitans telluris]|uniref:DUF4245 domain-containing protein n=1 Tax=Jatrophihabitans telluris TaxID=2038343 RepID=A0ABY4QXZ1_9ACTN|nr:DUF4245 domain-containing protein [Jatrophihabitans telluris]UQX87759.1 DUF4245 domain-containing protein [Jatrophihabitans telluris]
MTRPLTSAERQRLRTPANLGRSLFPLVALVGFLVLVTWPHGSHSDGVRVVDVNAAITSADTQAGFAVLPPKGLPTRWRPTSTQFVPPANSVGASFHIGWVSPSDKYAELLQGNDAADVVAAQYGPLTVSTPPSVAVPGQSGRSSAWQNFTRQDGRQLLRAVMGKVTVIVTGSAPQPELVQLAGSVT